MRILNVTETYAPFLEFGGPAVKVRALSEGLARRGHQVTVLSADWGLEKRLQSQEEKITAERSPFGWRRNENGVQAIYLPTWMRYRAVSWNPAVKRYCRARLQNFDVVHIFGLYDLLGPAGAVASRKRGLPYVLQASGMKKMTLVFAGPDEGGVREELDQMAVQLGVRTKVQFTGAIFGETKWAAYQDADVFVLPSQNENFGNAAAEAVAAGTPVIVTEQCGIAPLLADRTGLVVCHNTGALAGALERILSEAELRARLAAGCAAVTSRLGWDEPVRGMGTLYAALSSHEAVGAESKQVGEILATAP